MRISLIGMTGTGKSYWAKRLVQIGFKRFSCDDLIAEKLAAEINQYNDSIKSLGEWMGLPYEERYQERAERYLTLEVSVMNELVGYLESPDLPAQEKIVIDTSGSVIYTGPMILKKLQDLTTLVHLTTPPEIQKQVMAYYLAKPGPVLWQGKFNMLPDEPYEEAVMRCYPVLLASREKAYQAYADIHIDYYTRRKQGFSVEDLIRTICESTAYYSGPD